MAGMNVDKKANVLLVDDKSENLLALETVLDDLGQNLVRATSAREALRFLLLEDVALILLDVQMPGLSGFELAELIRERERTQHTPIIFISATSVNEQFIFKGYSLGAVDYITKPFDPEILKSKVRFFSRLYLQQSEIRRQARELGDANTRLDSVNTELEERVRQRTLELEKAYAEREMLLTREKALREEAEKANRLKDEFLATLSHELRTPLNSILGWSQIVLGDMIDEEGVRTALETIHRNATSQAQLIEELLDASRLITGKILLNLGPTEIEPALKAAIDTVRPKATAKNIEIDTDFQADVSSITSDASRLQQMVWNLLTNAVKFTPINGRITVSTKRVKDRLQIVVSDTGAGISDDFLPFVFDRFRQEDSTSTRRHDGLGLGLAIVRHLAELHGGTVSAASEGENKGSTFTVSLPASQATSAANGREGEVRLQNEPTPAKALEGIRIHVVDDDADSCRLLEYAFGLRGASVNTSSNAAEAFAFVTQDPPDILLADINMPDEDGYSLIQRVRAHEHGVNTSFPAIALTAMARTEDAERALAAGFQMHIPKPIEIEELTRTIAELLLRDRPSRGNGSSAASAS
jgi:signal transduction histidine kinase